jgi:hypothetical protein
MRLLAAGLLGAALAVAAAVILGDYPLSGAVPWAAAVVVPGVIGVTMAGTAGRHQAWLWAATGPLAAASFGWGVRIATGWGLDPVPATAWASMGITLVWPLAWAAVLFTRRRPAGRPTAGAPSN